MKKPQDRKNVGKNAGQKLQMQDRREDDRQDVNWTGRIMDRNHVTSARQGLHARTYAGQNISRTGRKRDGSNAVQNVCSRSQM